MQGNSAKWSVPSSEKEPAGAYSRAIIVFMPPWMLCLMNYHHVILIAKCKWKRIKLVAYAAYAKVLTQSMIYWYSTVLHQIFCYFVSVRGWWKARFSDRADDRSWSKILIALLMMLIIQKIYYVFSKLHATWKRNFTISYLVKLIKTSDKCPQISACFLQ